jgi:polysaccharide export outer membrane protein
LCGGLSFAQETAYTLGVDDILSIKIFAGGSTQDTFEVTVSSKGNINFPFLGEVKAAGLTVPQLTEAITRPLAQDYFVNPQVIIAVKEYKSKKVYVTGNIDKPGLYTLEGSTTLLEIIGKAGGVSKERSNFAFVIRGSLADVKNDQDIEQLIKQKKAVQVNLHELLDQGRTDKNILIEPNDIVYVQPANYADVNLYKIAVLGKVEHPGVYDYQEGLTALDAVTLAGGFAKYSAPNRTVITRRDSSDKVSINLDKVQKGKIKDIVLKPGDRIYVPESWF